MIREDRYKIFIILFILLLNIIITINSEGCKDIIAVGNATKDDFNYLLKVRDPSRPGLQVLCIIPEGYCYSYHNPWTGKKLDFKVEHKFIGVATTDDTIPNIIKAGMAFSIKGIAYGDADTNSNWKNPTKNAWDDFDWIRYACEKADDEEEAVKLLTKDIVDDMHASGVSENLFVVGPKKAFIIEADAFHYDIREVEDIEEMSNYPKELWKTQRHKKFLIALSFETTKEQYVAKGRILRLNSFYGVKIVDIGDDFIIARQVPFLKINKIPIIVGKKVKIGIEEREKVGDFSVKLINIDGRKAKISICTIFKAWEDEMLKHMEPRYGKIELKDMINWSRLTGEDLDGLRPMCEENYPYEAVMIYKIPKNNYDILSSGWFSANHACSSIYVPVHICNNEIYDAYLNGEAAKLSLDLLDLYGDSFLISCLNDVESVFLKDVEKIENISLSYIKKNIDVSDFLTIFDIGIQKQAMLTEKIWYYATDAEFEVIKGMWKHNYSISINEMQNTISLLKNIKGSENEIENILKIVLNICETKMNMAKSVGLDISLIKQQIDSGSKLFQEKQYNQGFKQLKMAYNQSNDLIEGKQLSIEKISFNKKFDKIDITNYFILFLIMILLIIIISIILRRFNEK